MSLTRHDLYGMDRAKEAAFLLRHAEAARSHTEDTEPPPENPGYMTIVKIVSAWDRSAEDEHGVRKLDAEMRGAS